MRFLTFGLYLLALPQAALPDTPLKFKYSEVAPANLLPYAVEVRFDALGPLYAGKPSAAVQRKLDQTLETTCKTEAVTAQIKQAIAEVTNPEWVAEGVKMWIQFRGPAKHTSFQKVMGEPPENGYHNYSIYFQLDDGACGNRMNLEEFWEEDRYGSIFGH